VNQGRENQVLAPIPFSHALGIAYRTPGRQSHLLYSPPFLDDREIAYRTLEHREREERNRGDSLPQSPAGGERAKVIALPAADAEEGRGDGRALSPPNSQHASCNTQRGANGERSACREISPIREGRCYSIFYREATTERVGFRSAVGRSP